MKIFLLADYYTEYLKKFYQKNDCDSMSYEEHLNFLLDDYFGSFGSYCRHFQRIGHDANLVIGNDYKLQQKWLDENNINIKANKKTKQSIVLLQVEKFTPDVFFMGSMFDYYSTFLNQVSNITENIFTWIACPYAKDLDFRNIKCVLTSSIKYVHTFRSMGIDSELLGAGFDEDILYKIKDKRKIYNTSFIGGLSSIHQERVDSLNELLKSKDDIAIFGYGLNKSFLGLFRSPLEKAYKGELWGLSMYEVLSRSSHTLNFHIKEADGLSANMRMYEATGCGTLLFTEESSNLHDLFEPNKEVISYKNIDDLKAKLTYYDEHKKEAHTIANAGQKKCLLEYGYNKRILEFEKIILKYI
jgi:spore maturation protein CgeB